jgi:glycerol transport system ATP-binding protein
MSLTLEHVSRAVDGQIWIDDASLSFEPGSFNVLLGRTLSGKTSLMRLMAGLDKPDSGRVLMNGKDVTQVAVRHRNVSMVYQQFINYPSMTVFDNIASPLRQAKMSRDEIESRVRETAKMLRIEKFLSRYPLELSGGQQQRTAVARALAYDPTVLLADELTAELDHEWRDRVVELVFDIAHRGGVVVLATHDPDIAAGCDVVVRLVDGRVAPPSG